MKIAVIGGGVAGLYTAWHLARDHEVVLFEREPRVGGHTDTHVIDDESGTVNVDTGFIVFNYKHYPLFSAWVDGLGVASRASDMSFGVHCERSGLEYNATSLGALFCQRRNLLRPRFLRMVADILRFYRNAPTWLQTLDESVTLGQWLEGSDFGEAFGPDHLVPMAAALWSSADQKILDFPIRYLLEFMHNHDMLQVERRPVWRTIIGGGQRYVEAALARFAGRVVTGAPVRRISRQDGGGLKVKLDATEAEFDQAVLACHADQALALLERPDPLEAKTLGSIAYQPNDAVLHTDAGRMPKRPKAWAAWNVRRDRDAPERAGISYWMNRLQGLSSARQYIVSLNQTDRIDPERILVRKTYQHPIYTARARAAQKRLPAINGRDRIWFCGACWGYGFHEDAVQSARTVVDGIAGQVKRRAA